MTDGKERSLDEIIADVKNKLDVIAEQEKEILKGFLWDLYSEQGMHPHQMRLAFNEAITLIENEERRWEEEKEEEEGEGNG